MVILPVAQGSTEASISIVIWVLVLVVLLVPAAAATLWLRRWVHQETGADTTVGFTLHDVQEMFKRGELDQAQYDRLRQEIITKVQRTKNLTLNDVRGMFDRGELSKDQYDRLRQEIIAEELRTLDAKVKPHRPQGDK